MSLSRKKDAGASTSRSRAPEPRRFKGGYIAASLTVLLSILLASFSKNVNPHPTVVDYYSILESRIGYYLILGNSRHCGLYSPGTISPFPISPALRRMEKKLYSRLNLNPDLKTTPVQTPTLTDDDSVQNQNPMKILDAGCGSAPVALSLARLDPGIHITAIDITPHHLSSALSNVAAANLSQRIDVQYADYHNTSAFGVGTFDAVYVMEAFPHAQDPALVLGNFYEWLKKGGVLVLHDYDFTLSGGNGDGDVGVDVDVDGETRAGTGLNGTDTNTTETKTETAHWNSTLQSSSLIPEEQVVLDTVRRITSCPSLLPRGLLPQLVSAAGFVDVEVEYLTEEVKPLVRLFGYLGWLPYQIFKMLGVKDRFPNTMTGVEVWTSWGREGYFSLRAVKG